MRAITTSILGALIWAASSGSPQAAAASEGRIAEVPFAAGEKLNFSVYWSLANIGTAFMNVTGVEEVGGQSCWRIEAGANSNKTIDLFYQVRDRFFTFIDQRELFTRKFIKHQSEGRHKRNRELIYDQENHRVHDLVSGEEKDCVPEAQDQLSIFYYFRTLEMEVGDGILLEGFVDKKQNPLKVEVVRREWVEVPAGRFHCLVVEPFIKSGGLFEHKGNIHIWLTDDSHRLPVKVSSQLDFGKIVVLLESFELGT
ncbi:MAG: DUF3108 domain-containing protein [Gemmatimonadota bacterium]|nr:DUF3108 domain-containing protein [Gemmatimonadota bacterium]